MNNELYFYRKRNYGFYLFLTWMIGGAGGAVVIGNFGASLVPSEFLAAVMMAWVIGLVLCLTFIVSRLQFFQENHLHVVVNAEGIRNVDWKWDILLWEDISAVSISRPARSPRRYVYPLTLHIRLKNPQKYTRYMSISQRIAFIFYRSVNITSGFGSEAVSVPQIWRYIERVNASEKINIAREGKIRPD